MLIFDIGPVYIRAAITFYKNIQSSSTLDYFLSEIEKNKNKLDFIINDLSLEYNNKVLYFFKINLFRLDAFQNSYDYELINYIVLQSKFTTSYFCGLINEKVEKLIFNLFAVKLIKLGHINQLSILGLEYISENIPKSFFDLPGQHIYNLVQVGHKLNEVTHKNYYTLKDKIFPFLMANIVEGVSVYKVESADNFNRIGGNTFGMTSYWSLVSMACGYVDPEVAVKDAIKGNNELIDLSVGDIYGGSYDKFNLNSQIIASSFGKLKNIGDIDDVNNQDVSRSLMTLLCVNVSQIIAMLAINSDVYQVLIVGNPCESLEFMQMVQMAMNYFSNEKVKCYFSDYSPYINLIGLLREMEQESEYFNIN